MLSVVWILSKLLLSAGIKCSNSFKWHNFKVKNVDKFFLILTEPISIFICVCAKFHDSYSYIMGKYFLFHKNY